MVNAMVSSQLFLTHVLQHVALNLGKQVDKYRQEEQIYRQIQCVKGKRVTYFTAHLPVICWLA